MKDEPDVAAVLALTPRREVVLVREFRPGPEAWLLPGGVVGPGERPEEAAARELLEETGYAGDVRGVGSAIDCAYSTRTRHACVAEDARRVAASAEALEVVLMSLPDFREHLRGGRLTDVDIGYRGLDALGLL